ncbi:uncharacterized protein EV420DRAFT_1574706 [Desarmillaria tabescens]|uniref:AAA-ATPase-like domain-containing protein n=1 Tax=Armillaria tabescens TaxID=1929756 RepID=A0AA39JKK5_ARMTA|nr:uncharacterized protein EV420DRAFT_1574706 [Desarmillaria tabescens]KAK0444194.1 hypothetical protein EV420DRAFT_1574706 [Desarmillaria tabescens]
MSPPSFFLALAGHNGHQVYLSSSKNLGLTPNATIEQLRDRVQRIHDISCHYCHATRLRTAWKCTLGFPVGATLLDARPAEAVKLNDEDPLALHFPVPIELMFDIEKLGMFFLSVAAGRARNKKPPKIIHEHTRKDLGNGVYTNPELSSVNLHLPPDQCTDFRELVLTPGRLYVDKTSTTLSMEEHGINFFGVVRRPPGCGKTTWLSALAHLHDIHHARSRRLAPFADNIPLPNANNHHILRLDLAELVPFARTEDDYKPEDSSSCGYSRTYMYAARALKEFVCEELRRFFDKYREEIHISDRKKRICLSYRSARSCFSGALEEIFLSPHPLYMLVDNYTAPFLHEHLDEDTKSEIDVCLHDEFFCNVGSLIDHGRLDRVFIVGESVPREYKCNYGLGNLGKDYTTAAAMQETFGFTAAQVLTMSEALGIEKGRVIEAFRKEGITAETFMREEKEEYIGCFKYRAFEFDQDDLPAAVYPMRPVLDVLRRLEGNEI